LQDSAVGLDRAALEGLRQMILAGGAGQLAVGDLCGDDLANLAWSGNPVHLRSVARARRLYERLGYQAAGRQHASWEYEDDDGVLRLYETTLTILRKRL
jgi:hypothetical protein